MRAADRLRVRIATDRDVEAVRCLLRETWHDTFDGLLGSGKVTEITNVWHAAAVLKRQIDDPDGRFLLAEQRGRIVGHAHLLPDKADAGLLYLGRLYILPLSQRQGIGTHLLASGLHYFPQARRIWLKVAAGNGRAVAFYRKAGFVVSGEEIAEGLPHLQMTKVIGTPVKST
jgi:ribosomal protein S18 acetylase RimI-like enzyme